jgi:hypothetical protein
LQIMGFATFLQPGTCNVANTLISGETRLGVEYLP